jgi:hypothetical protein
LRKLLLAAGACVWLAGCATAETVATSESPSEREYPTGSNIPRKAKSANPQADGIRVHSREDFERVQSMGTGVSSRGSAPGSP